MIHYARFTVTLIIVFTTKCSISFADQFKVVRVSDGDTIQILKNGGNVRVRLVAIDAPETSKGKQQPGQPFSQKSTKYLAGLVLNRMVEIKEFGRNRYDRILGVVFVGRKNVNLEMVKVGLAEVYRGRPAEGLELDSYQKAEIEAKTSRKGMRVLGDKYLSPRELRKNWSKN